MRRVLVLAAVTLLTAAGLGTGRANAQDYKKGPGPHEVAVSRLDWKDKNRDREVPAKVYAPKSGAGPFPVIVFSHGLGGSREGYEYLGRHWASHGYVCVHLQHQGSDDAVWKGSAQPLADLRKAARNVTNAVNRPLDVRFALDRLAEWNRDDPALKGRLDLGRVGMAGHSFGGWTTQAVIGEVFATPLGKELSLPEPRVKAAVIMSPSPAPGKADQDKAFGAIKVPCLHLTGTKDDGVSITEVKPADRRVPYDHIKKADQYLVILTGGDHMVFSGARCKAGDGTKDGRFHDLTRMATTAFWDAYLKEDAAARTWLQRGGFRKALGEDGTLEQKKAARD